MNNPQQNKFNMYQAVSAVLESHKPIWTALTGFSAAVDDLETNLSTIASLAQVQAARSGAAAEKNAALESLLDAAQQIAGATRAGAVVNKDAELAAKADYSRSDLARGRAGEVVARCRNLWSAANDNVDVLGAFGVTTGKLTTLKKKIDDFESSQPRPRQDRANTRAATRTLPDLFEATDEILNDCLDGLVVQFKSGDAEFYNTYTTARRIVDGPGVRKVTAVPAPNPVPEPA
jgi:hypothetical protein